LGVIAAQRLRSQRLAGRGFAAPADTVRWFGAVQAQEYWGGLWALGLRTTGATEASVEQAIAERKIVRSWPLRGTLHFTTPEDLRWMLKWLAPVTLARCASRFRQFELDAPIFARSAKAIVKALEGGQRLTRPQIYARLERAGVVAQGGRGSHILFRLANDGLICFATHEGRQPTFALLEEWLPVSPLLDRDEALAELARRYFTSHGPATLQDFIWWSGLSAADARAAFALAGSPKPARADATVRSPHVLLLPPYDEYMVAYKDRSAALDPKHATATRNGIFSPTIVIDGRIAGLWTRRSDDAGVTILLQPLTRLNRSQSRATAAAATRYGRFLGRPVHRAP
jgi:hypothetical protein